MLEEITHFVNWIRRRNPIAHTWQDYRSDLRHFVATVGDRDPAKITYRDIDAFVNDQVDAGYAPATVNRRLTTIASLYDFLATDDPTLVCPVIIKRHGLHQRRRLPRPVPAADLAAFFAQIEGSRDKAMFTLMLRCGLRRAEIAALKLSDLYLHERPPRLVVCCKNRRERAVYLSPQASYALRHYLAERPPVASDYVFLSYQGDGLTTTAIHKRLMRYRKRAGVHLTGHQLRHTFANDLVAADVPITTVQKLLGHTWVATTQVYVVAADPKVKADFYAAMQRLSGW